MIVGAVVLLVALLLGGVLGTLIMRDPGYVLIAFDGTTIETSLWFTLLVIALVAGLVMLISYLVKRLIGSRTRLARWFARRRATGSRRRTVQGLLHLAEGRWKEAKRDLVAGVGQADTPFINYLHAARAANKLNNIQERDQYLQYARESTPGAEFAVGVTLAEMQADVEDWMGVRATLKPLLVDAPRHPQLLRLLFDASEATEDDAGLLELVGPASKSKAVPAARVAAAERGVWLRRLDAAGVQDEPVKSLEATWDQMSRGLRKHPEMLAAYGQALASLDAPGEALPVIRRAVKAQWSDELVNLYGVLGEEDENLVERVKVAEGWLKQQPENGALRVTLARLKLASGDLDAAQKHLDKSMEISTTPDALMELGRLHLKREDAEAASESFSRAMRLAAGIASATESVPDATDDAPAVTAA